MQVRHHFKGVAGTDLEAATRGVLPPSARGRGGLSSAPGIPRWDHGTLLKAHLIVLVISAWYQQTLQNNEDASKTLTALTNTYHILSNYLSIT